MRLSKIQGAWIYTRNELSQENQDGNVVSGNGNPFCHKLELTACWDWHCVCKCGVGVCLSVCLGDFFLSQHLAAPSLSLILCRLARIP